MWDDLAGVVAGAVEDGEDRGANRSLERAACQMFVVFHKAALRFDGAEVLEQLHQFGRQAFKVAADQYFCRRHIVPAGATTHDSQDWLLR